ncbi:MAG: metal ABC transporter permease [bacterium]|nr:metal ABC transporter permease [bacterium]
MLELIQYGFFRNALTGILLLSISAAIIGTYIVTRRLAALAGGVTHACFGGLGLGYFMGWNPLWPAMAFAVAASAGVERLSTGGRVRSDSAVAVVWALGMAVGVLFVFLTPGYVPELNAFLFGNILTISTADLWMEGAYVALLMGLFAVMGRRIVACAFDADFAQVAGLPARGINALMSVMTSIGIVLTIRLVGVMLLMSMLVLPALTAECLTRSYRRITLLAAVLCLGSSLAALWLSTLVDVPCSAFIVLVQGAAYALTRLLTSRRQ